MVSYFDRALLSQVVPLFPVAAERELRTLAEALDALMSGQIMTAMDIIGQQCRAVETSILEEGGWGVARHLEVVPETRVSSVTPGLRAMMAAEERQSHRVRQDLWKRPRDPHRKPWIEHPNSRRSQGEVNQPGSADDLPSAVDPTVSKVKKRSKANEKAKAAFERSQAAESEQRQGSQAWLAGRSH